MADSTDAHEVGSKTIPDLDGYESMMLKLYLETLAKQNQDLHVLDMGPVCEENIMFFSKRVKKLFICDMFIRMDRRRRKGKSTSSILNHLDYPANSFHGIHFWGDKGYRYNS